MHIEYEIKKLNDIEIAVSKKVEVGATMPTQCQSSMQELRAGMLNQQNGFKNIGEPIPTLNGNPKIINNRHICGLTIVGELEFIQEWEDIDNITEADLKEYEEYLYTTPSVGNFTYDLEKKQSVTTSTDKEVTDWHFRAIHNYNLNVPKMTTRIKSEDAKIIYLITNLQYDFRQKDIAPNGEEVVEKKTAAGFEEDTYLYMHRPCQIDGTDYDEDTFILQSNDATIKNLTNKPNRIVQFWRTN